MGILYRVVETVLRSLAWCGRCLRRNVESRRASNQRTRDRQAATATPVHLRRACGLNILDDVVGACAYGGGWDGRWQWQLMGIGGIWAGTAQHGLPMDLPMTQ
jgi:hypothetical protein